MNFCTKSKAVVLLLLLVCCFLQGSRAVAADPPLEFWIHPYLHAPELVRRFTPLVQYLEKKTGRKIEIRIALSYESHKERLGQDRADLAFVGPFSYAQMTERHGPKSILATLESGGTTSFHGVIAVRRDSPIRQLADLTGRSFAFGDKESTMGTLVPRFILAKAGVGIDGLSRYTFLHSHNDVALAVLGGFYDAGGLKEEVFQEYAPRGLRLLARTPPIPEHLFLASKKLPTELVQSLRAALLALKDPAILKPIQQNATGMVALTDRDYDPVRRIYRGLGPMPGE